jgi:hypothetical protein
MSRNDVTLSFNITLSIPRETLNTLAQCNQPGDLLTGILNLAKISPVEPKREDEARVPNVPWIVGKDFAAAMELSRKQDREIERQEQEKRNKVEEDRAYLQSVHSSCAEELKAQNVLFGELQAKIEAQTQEISGLKTRLKNWQEEYIRSDDVAVLEHARNLTQHLLEKTNALCKLKHTAQEYTHSINALEDKCDEVRNVLSALSHPQLPPQTPQTPQTPQKQQSVRFEDSILSAMMAPASNACCQGPKPSHGESDLFAACSRNPSQAPPPPPPCPCETGRDLLTQGGSSPTMVELSPEQAVELFKTLQMFSPMIPQEQPTPSGPPTRATPKVPSVPSVPSAQHSAEFMNLLNMMMKQ